MPTGYTHPVQNGQITTLAEYAIMCARAFGATITMRDEPMSTPIPDHFEPSTYHEEQRKQAEARLARLDRLSPIEAQTLCQAEYAASVRSWARRCDERALWRVRYQAMLDEALAWVPPTREHDDFQRFMISQLEESIDWDCSSGYGPFYPQQKRWPEWLEQEREKERKDIAYHTDQLMADITRAMKKTNWVQALRWSLK